MSRERRRKRDERRGTQAMVAWFREQDLHPEGIVVDGEPTLLVTYGERWQGILEKARNCALGGWFQDLYDRRPSV
jgi:hypothetical protein